MKDKISIERIKNLHPEAIGVFQRFMDEIEENFNTSFRVVQGYRTFEEQDELYAQGRSKPGAKVTNAKGGQSYHCYGLAIDIVELKGKEVNWNFDYSKLEPIGEKYGLYWGGNFNDKPHFELSFGYTWKQLLEKYKSKEFIPGTKFVKL